MSTSDLAATHAVDTPPRRHPSVRAWLGVISLVFVVSGITAIASGFFALFARHGV
ncbi:hypothetical protein [Planotetraspora mira]|uniref:hypothetical protein n=1 Tax=Planotetraspora mira TaxID=58121 RepID=UPI003671EC66